MSEPVGPLPSPWKHVVLSAPPRNGSGRPALLAKVWMPPVPGCLTGRAGRLRAGS